MPLEAKNWVSAIINKPKKAEAYKRRELKWTKLDCTPCSYLVLVLKDNIGLNGNSCSINTKIMFAFLVASGWLQW